MNATSTTKPVPIEGFHEAVDRFVRAFDPQRVILFGSYARGAAGPSSDLYLLIVREAMPCGQRARAQLVAAVLAVKIGGVRVDAWVLRPRELDAYLDAGYSFYAEALSEGVTLHERPVRVEEIREACAQKLKP